MKKKQTNFPLHPLIEKRWSPRAFSEISLNTNDVDSIFEAARWAPSSYNKQPWRFIYAYKSEVDKFERILESLIDTNRAWAKDAPLLAVAMAVDIKNNTKATFDLGTAVAFMNIQAIEKNIYMHHMGGFDADIIRQNFKIDELITPFVVLAFGYLGKSEKLSHELLLREKAPQERLDLDAIII